MQAVKQAGNRSLGDQTCEVPKAYSISPRYPAVITPFWENSIAMLHCLFLSTSGRWGHESRASISMLVSIMYAPSLSALVVGVRLATRSIVVNSWSWVKHDHRGVCWVGGTLLHNDHEIKYYTGIDFTQTFRISLFLYISVNLIVDKLLLELLL